jgi:CheY-like chemotaxis protein
MKDANYISKNTYFCNSLTNQILYNMKKILVAEDNDSNYILMTYVLKRYYEFQRAVNGREAVDMALAGGFDMVLMDIKMPVMDGLEATKAIKEKMPELPVVALTANAFDSDRQLALECGCDDFLTKPISSVKCLETIAKFIGK